MAGVHLAIFSLPPPTISFSSHISSTLPHASHPLQHPLVLALSLSLIVRTSILISVSHFLRSVFFMRLTRTIY
ncbi:hypothetical protein HD806DRAFT_509966 [Xylariaceae sp. AK1471]|nr:hypothetical protein HD806DRAFT_509966 [Xylariaceae sp. AK1471]